MRGRLFFYSPEPKNEKEQFLSVNPDDSCLNPRLAVRRKK